MSRVGSAEVASVKAEELRAVAASLGGAPAAPSAPPAAQTPPRAPATDSAPVPDKDAATGPRHDHREVRAKRVPLGEELPVFCERCGYALHGLPQQRCDRCAILRFSCPECGHHQPINTLRPAAQRVLGRIRAFVLGLWVLFKINFFGWLLFAWFGMGVEWAYRFNSTRTTSNPNNWTYQMVPRPVDTESIIAFTVFGLAFGMFGRMLLLRWRRGWAVGGTLGMLVILASYAGAWFRSHIDVPYGRSGMVLPVGGDFQLLLVCTGLTITFAAVVVWWIWLALVHLFLPDRTAAALLNWQRSMMSAAPALARME